MADHMLVAEWTSDNGWDRPRIVPFGPLAIPPSASVLHYGIEVAGSYTSRFNFYSNNISLHFTTLFYILSCYSLRLMKQKVYQKLEKNIYEGALQN